MSARVLLNLLNELGENIRGEPLLSILPVPPNEFNKFSNTGARMQLVPVTVTSLRHYRSR